MTDVFYPKEVAEAWESGRRQGMRDAAELCQRSDIIFASSAAEHIKQKLTKHSEEGQEDE